MVPNDISGRTRILGLIADPVVQARRTGDGRLVGTMLDGEGFVAGLRSAGHEVRKGSCLLVGAGGEASAIAFALARHGCRSLTIVNRTASKARSLAARVREAFPGVRVEADDHEVASYDLAINATSLGMREEHPLPMSREVIAASTLVAECVIAPEMTPRLDAARAKGCVA
jgi:shikimate dehydrogenase